MKVQFEETQKRKAAKVGDIMQYRLNDNSVINGMIIMISAGQYAMLNLETCLCGSINTDSPERLANEYRDENNFVLYQKSEWDAELNIKPKYEVCE